MIYTISCDDHVTKENRIKKGDKKTMRDMKKNAEQGRSFIRKHERADLKAVEVIELISQSREEGSFDINKLYEAICDAFYMGVAVGARNA